MAMVKCAISGLTFKVSYGPLLLNSSDGYFHPIFAAPQLKLYNLYVRHCKNQLSEVDSYLLFLSFLHATGKITWKHPATLIPGTETNKLVENNFRQLITVTEQSNVILHPSFSQPSFVVDKDNSKLRQIPNWIAAWEDNLISFQEGYRSQRLQEDLQRVENKLSYYLASSLPPEMYSFAIANWAAKAANFPPEKTEEWKKVIRTCFNSEKIFHVKLSLIKEIKEFCEENIEAGSIHFHSLMSTLKSGMKRNLNFLGSSSFSTEVSIATLGYSLLPVTSSKQDEEISAIILSAPTEAPKKEDYVSDLDFLRARLKFRVAQQAKNKQ
jgi:hypothetical protein